MYGQACLQKSALLIAVFGASFTLPACDKGTTTPSEPPGPETPVPPEVPTAQARSYQMGWAPTAPRPETPLVLAIVDSFRIASEVAILQQEVPWPELLGGTPMDVMVEDRGGLVDFLRAKGLQILFLVDPLDGLDRTREAHLLLEEGRSLLEPEIRQIHEDWVRAITTRVRPRWFGLASEINTLAESGDPVLYAEIVDLVNTLAPEVRALSPETQVFVSFQADQANGHVPGGNSIDHFSLIDDFDIDAVGLSSYPFFFFPTPADVPDNMFTTFDDATDLPLIYVEGGWGSADVVGKSSTPQQQVEWFERYEELLDEVEAELWVMLTFTDFDMPALGLPPERETMLANFASMGVMDIDLNRKPAYDTWRRISARPLLP